MADSSRLSDQILEAAGKGQKRSREDARIHAGHVTKKPKLDSPKHNKGHSASDDLAQRLGGQPAMVPSKDRLPALPEVKDAELKRKVFLHMSKVSEQALSQESSSAGYEGLEWYGDAVIQIVATRLIHKRFPRSPVGDKAAMRQSLVENSALAKLARRYGFDKPGKIVVNDNVRTQSFVWPKILADVFEAYVGAVVDSNPLDGMQIAEAWLAELWEPQLLAFMSDHTKSNNHGCKQRLMQLLQNVKAEVKIDFSEDKPPDASLAKGKVWHSRKVILTGWGFDKQELGRGSGWSTKFADNEAARNALADSKSIIDVANTRKKEFEAKRQAAKEAAEQADTETPTA